MSLKKVLRTFLEREGTKKGRIKLLNIIREITNDLDNIESVNNGENAYNSLMRNIGIPSPEDLTEKTKGLTTEDPKEIFRKADPVTPKSIGIFDPNLTMGKNYRIIELNEDMLWIYDDSGKLSPYLRSRFKNTSIYLKSGTNLQTAS